MIIKTLIRWKLPAVKDKGGQIERNIANDRNITRISHLHIQGVVESETLGHDVR